MLNRQVYNFALIFIISFGAAVAFQNCGEGARVSPSVLLNTGEPGSGDGDNFSFNLGAGDAIVYAQRDSFKSETTTINYSLQFTGVHELIEIYEVNSNSQPDLPTSYCDESALPHCRHQNTMTCMAIGCPEIPQPIRCSYGKRLNQNEVESTFAMFANFEVIEKTMQPNEVVPGDCLAYPYILFNKKDKPATKVNLMKPSCVDEGEFYALSDTLALESTMTSKASFVKDLGEFCNRFNTYNWQSTRFVYEAQSGLTTPDFFSSSQVEYSNGVAKLRFRLPGDGQTYCADDVPVTEFDSFFPLQGITYRVFRTDAALADAPTAQISYQDEAFGNNRHYRFYLDEPTAATYQGGAIISAEQATAIKAAVQSLIERAQTQNFASVCN